jgi:hypothetical protein
MTAMERQADPAAPPQPCNRPLDAGATQVPGNEHGALFVSTGRDQIRRVC